MLSLRYYLESMKTSLDVISKTYFINDSGKFYTGADSTVPSLLNRINLYNLHESIGKTVYVQYQGLSSDIIPSDFKPYYQTKIVGVIHYEGNDYIKFNNLILSSSSTDNQFEFSYMRLVTVPIVMIFSED